MPVSLVRTLWVLAVAQSCWTDAFQAPSDTRFSTTATNKISTARLLASPNGASNEKDAKIKYPYSLDYSHMGRDVDENDPTKTNGYDSMGGYRRMLQPRTLGMGLDKIFHDDENEDGWSEMRKQKLPWWRRMTLPLGLVLRRTKKEMPDPGTLILLRHGTSTWNSNKTFTGWADADLSDQGRREAEHAARLLLEGGYELDVVFTSRLTRAIRSAWIVLQEMNEVYLPVFKSWRLNERFYGALTGLSKTETAERLGSNLVQEWRCSLRSRPPALRTSDYYWPGRDRRYADLTLDQLPKTESLMDCMNRCSPLWEQRIKYELQSGRNVLVVGHANTLRGLVKIIDHVSDDEIRDVTIPTGIPIVYKFDEHMKPIAPQGEQQSMSQVHMHGLFLAKPGLLKEALKKEEQWSQQVPGYHPTMERYKTPLSSLEASLYKLRAERELGKWAGQFMDPAAMLEDDGGDDGNLGKPIRLREAQKRIKREAAKFDPHQSEFRTPPLSGNQTRLNGIADVFGEDENVVKANLVSNQPCVTSAPSAVGVPGMGDVPVRRDAVIVIIRHSKTEHNILKLFTGWEDVPLAAVGVEEAKAAGRLLKAHGFEFDVVYTSWLSRAIQTAWHVIDEMDALWLPIIKTWRLNERMYGTLTGLSKEMVKQRHGDKQFKAWRRGFDTPPPPVSSFSKHYPGNDRRYQKYLNDVRFSVRETLIRSIEQGAFTPSRKLPKTESLKDCMDRTIPFFTERIVPEAINQGKRVLISSSENAIRGLLMHLCEIPEDKISELEIPNGLPILYDIKSKCIKLLDDGTGRDPLEVHDFGKAASYLFRPCETEDGSIDEECDITYYQNGSSSLSEADKAAIQSITKQTPVSTSVPK